MNNEDFKVVLSDKEYIEKLEKELYYQNKEVTRLNNIINEKDKKIDWLNDLIKIMENYFELIVDLGYDYDGLETTGDLMNLMDELVRYASLGRAYNITEPIYENSGKKYNILHEELKENK